MLPFKNIIKITQTEDITALRRHTMAPGAKPPVSHHKQLIVEFDKWLQVFHYKTNLYTNDMKEKFTGLVKAAKDLVNGKSSVNTTICPASKEKAGQFLVGAGAYFGRKLDQLPNTTKAVTEALALILEYKKQGERLRNRYFGKLFKKPEAGKPVVSSLHKGAKPGLSCP